MMRSVHGKVLGLFRLCFIYSVEKKSPSFAIIWKPISTNGALTLLTEAWGKKGSKLFSSKEPSYYAIAMAGQWGLTKYSRLWCEFGVDQV